jgi:hypothetical protein
MEGRLETLAVVRPCDSEMAHIALAATRRATAVDELGTAEPA